MNDHLDEPLTNLMARRLIQEFPDQFSHYFTDGLESLNIPTATQDEAQKTFTEIYPAYSFDEFIKTYRQFKQQSSLNDEVESTVPAAAPRSQICNSAAIFDPQHRKYIRPNIIPPHKKRRVANEDYDPIKFLTDQENNLESFPLNFDMDTEEELGYLNYENDRRKSIVTDNSIRKIVKLVAILNNACSYPILDFHGSQNIK